MEKRCPSTGTKMCKVCNKRNASVSLFLCNDIFCSRTTVNWDMIKHYSIVAPEILTKNKYILEHGKD